MESPAWAVAGKARNDEVSIVYAAAAAAASGDALATSTPAGAENCVVGLVAPVDLGDRVVDRGLDVAHIDQALHVVRGREMGRLNGDRVPASDGVRDDGDVRDDGVRTRRRWVSPLLTLWVSPLLTLRAHSLRSLPRQGLRRSCATRPRPERRGRSRVGSGGLVGRAGCFQAWTWCVCSWVVVVGQLVGAGGPLGWRVRRCESASVPPRPSIASARPAAAPIPASPQSKPLLGVMTRTIVGSDLWSPGSGVRLGCAAAVVAVSVRSAAASASVRERCADTPAEVGGMGGVGLGWALCSLAFRVVWGERG